MNVLLLSPINSEINSFFEKNNVTYTQTHKKILIEPVVKLNPDFIFVAQQYLERHSFENQISVSVQRGILTQRPDGSKEVKSRNAIDVFKEIPGTPAYWKKFRNEIFARMEQLGGFHFFFTLSCADLRWNENFAAILRAKKYEIIYDFEEDQDGYPKTAIYVNDGKHGSDKIPL